MTILIVDDSTAIRQVTRHVLERTNWQVREASNAASALLMLSGVDCILTDLNMPGTTGIELVRTIRSRHIFIPIVMMTTEQVVEKRQEAQQAGITAWLHKPYIPDDLIKIIQKVTGSS